MSGLVQYGMPATLAMFLWWFGTGAVLCAARGRQSTFPVAMASATALAAAGLGGIAWSAGSATTGGAYTAFIGTMLVWAWLEATFYLGYVTGPRRHACHHGCSGLRHFGHALGVSLYHELAIVGAVAIVAALTWHAPNRLALWTMLVLWTMHESARLNVFLGVRNVSEEFVPAHMAFLRSFLRRRPMNPLFPVSIALAGVAGIALIRNAAVAGTPFETASATFLAAMTTIGFAEHWFLFLPISAETLWSWTARRPLRGDVARTLGGHA
ncbi:MAG: DUF3623 domain-containing protein [Proteobacteria bacterium]|nr:DUF3623 domain-containing protein [Pseudomonadota bacterium]